MQLSLRQKILVVSTTEDQKKAIEFDGKSILVSASAGSGKTEVLSKRILSKILLKKSSIKNILAMTFTNAAAAEMKNRIAKAINYELDYKKLTEHEMLEKVFHNQENFIKIQELYHHYQPLSKEEEQYLLDEKSNLLNADITTIDGFALSIVKRFFIVLHDFKLERLNRLLPESKRIEFLSESTKKVIRKYFHHHYHQLIQYRTLNKSFIQLISKLSIYPNPIEKIHEWKNSAKQVHISKIEDSVLTQFLINRINSLKSELKRSIIYYLQEVEVYKETKKRVEVKNYLHQLMNRLNNEHASLNQIHNLFESLMNMEHISFSKSKEFNDELNYQISLFHKNKEKLMKLVKSNFEPEQNIFLFYEMLEEIYVEYEKLKVKENYIEFSDITRYAVEILEKNKDIRKQYQDHFHEILVDEFQDTNAIQDHLIQLVSKNNKNVFRVGDIKQSIYGFRQAKPEIMKNYYDLYSRDINAGENIVLNINFRSSFEIIEFNNLAFQQLMNVENMACSFRKEADYAYSNSAPLNQLVNFHRLVTEEKDEDKTDKVFKYISSEIIKNISNNNYKDYAILVRSNEQVRIASRILTKMNLPHFALMDDALYESEVVQLLLAIHSLCFDSSNDLYFTAVASSRIFNLSFNEISQIRLKSRYSLFENAPIHFQQFIFDLRQETDFKKRTLKILNYKNFYIEKLNEEEKITVDYLLTLFDIEEIFTIQQGIDFLKSLNEKEYTKPNLFDSNSNMITIMNIHKSKGLEFKNVYLYCPDHESSDTSGVIYKYHDDLGVSFEYRKGEEKIASLYHELITQKNKISDIEEDLRILYVATTRAKNQLHLVGFSKYKNEPLSLSLLESSSKYASYILSLAPHLKEKNMMELKEINYDEYEIAEVLKKEEKNGEKFYTYTKVSDVLEKTSAHHIDEVQPLVFDRLDTYSKGSALHKEIEVVAKTKVYNSHKIQKLFENNWFNQLLKEYDTYFELAYHYKHHNVLESGYMDFVAIGEDVVVIDFKSDQFTDYDTYSKITEEELINRYQKQLIMYQNALMQAYPNKEVRAYIYSLELEKMIRIEVN